MMDELEIALELLDCANDLGIEDQELSATVSVHEDDFDPELHAAAGMILSQEELDSLEAELAALRTD